MIQDTVHHNVYIRHRLHSNHSQCKISTLIAYTRRIYQRQNIFKKLIALTVLSILCLFPAAALTFNPLAGSVRTFWSDENGLPSNRVLDIMQDEVGYIWIASYEGLVRFDGQTFTEFTEENHGFTGVSPRVLCEDIHGGLWIGTNSTGLYRYYDKTFTHYGMESGLPNISIRSLRFDKQNTLWVGTTEGIARMTPSGTFEPVLTEAGNNLGIISFILPVRDSLFVGSNVNGISVVRDGRIIDLPFLDEMKEYSFASAYLDADGVIWFGTNDGKIIKVKNERIIGMIALDYLQGSSINEFIKTIDGIMYIATNKGIITLRRDEADWFSEENGLPNNIVSCICADREENIWVGMEHIGIGKFSKGRFVALTNAKSLPPVSINSVMEDKDGSIWIAKDHGIVCLKADYLPAERSYRIDTVVDLLEHIRVRQIREDPDGTIFFSTYSDKGLLIFHPDGEITTLSKEDGLPNNKIRFSYRSSDGALWIGTTAGLVLYYNEKITVFTRDDGLPNLFMLSGIETSSGKMWFGTDGGGLAEFSIADLEADRPRLIYRKYLYKKRRIDGKYRV